MRFLGPLDPGQIEVWKLMFCVPHTHMYPHTHTHTHTDSRPRQEEDRVRQQPAPGPSRQQPTPGQSHQQPAPGPSRQQPAPGPSRQQPAPGPSHQQPAPGPSHQQPTPGPSSQQPARGPEQASQHGASEMSKNSEIEWSSRPRKEPPRKAANVIRMQPGATRMAVTHTQDIKSSFDVQCLCHLDGIEPRVETSEAPEKTARSCGSGKGIGETTN
uniref:Uncharacterized protein n=1 Tax=Takifugu rubripes TaxID=31033 RepID=A0A674N8R5_TAKRU